MKLAASIGIGIVLTTYLLFAQKPEGDIEGSANIKLVNASTAESISIAVDEQVYYPDFKFGDKVSKFKTDKLRILFEVKNNDNGMSLSIPLELEADSYNSLIILGSFDLTAKEPSLKDGDTSKFKESEQELDAKFIAFQHKPYTKSLLFQYRFLNVIQDETINISIDGKNPFQLEYLEEKLQEYQPKDCTFSVTTSGSNEEPLIIKLIQESPFSNAYFIIHRKDGKLSYLAVPLEVPQND
jgi:hypothetical protein